MAHHALDFYAIFRLARLADGWEHLNLRYDGHGSIYLIFWLNIIKEPNIMDEIGLYGIDGFAIEVEVDFLELFFDLFPLHGGIIFEYI